MKALHEGLGVGLALVILSTPGLALAYEDDERQAPVVGFEVGPNFIVNDDDLDLDSVDNDSSYSGSKAGGLHLCRCLS